MRYEDDERNGFPKRLKRSKNRPGEGMRVLNKYVEEESDEDSDYIYTDDDFVDFQDSNL